METGQEQLNHALEAIGSQIDILGRLARFANPRTHLTQKSMLPMPFLNAQNDSAQTQDFLRQAEKELVENVILKHVVEMIGQFQITGLTQDFQNGETILFFDYTYQIILPDLTNKEIDLLLETNMRSHSERLQALKSLLHSNDTYKIVLPTETTPLGLIYSNGKIELRSSFRKINSPQFIARLKDTGIYERKKEDLRLIAQISNHLQRLPITNTSFEQNDDQITIQIEFANIHNIRAHLPTNFQIDLNKNYLSPEDLDTVFAESSATEITLSDITKSTHIEVKLGYGQRTWYAYNGYPISRLNTTIELYNIGFYDLPMLPQFHVIKEKYTDPLDIALSLIESTQKSPLIRVFDQSGHLLLDSTTILSVPSMPENTTLQDIELGRLPVYKFTIIFMNPQEPSKVLYIIENTRNGVVIREQNAPQTNRTSSTPTSFNI